MSPILNLRVSIDARDPEGQSIALPPGWALEQMGPRLKVALFPMAAEGNPPAPVTGLALIDTGAQATCVDREAAAAAGMSVVDSAPMASATHEHEVVPLFAGRIRIPDFPEIATRSAFGANLHSLGLVALIGRDVLKSCVLVYNGPEGTVSLSV